MVEVVEKIEVREEKPAQLDETGKVLLKARDYIREHGWCQNSYMNFLSLEEIPEVCLLGAVNHGLGAPLDEDDWLTDDLRNSIIGRLGFVLGSEASAWNDTTDRTQQEVEERLERAAYNIP